METATIQCDVAREAQRKLTKQLEEAKSELAKALEQVEALEGKRGHDEPGRAERSYHDISQLVGQLDDLPVQLKEEHDLVDRKQWEMDELETACVPIWQISNMFCYTYIANAYCKMEISVDYNNYLMCYPGI